MKKREIHHAHLGNGYTFYDVLHEVNNDFEQVAHVNHDRSVTIYAKLTKSQEKHIFNVAKTDNSGVSVCQPEQSVFSIPPNEDYEYILINGKPFKDGSIRKEYRIKFEQIPSDFVYKEADKSYNTWESWAKHYGVSFDVFVAKFIEGKRMSKGL